MRASLARVGVLLAVAGCGAVPEQGPDVVAYELSSMSRLIVGRSTRLPGIVLLDRSSGMGLPLDAADPACPVGCGAARACPAGCVTRLDEVRRNLVPQLPLGDGLRWGLATFPADGRCAAPASLTVPLPSREADELGENRQAVRALADIERALECETASGGYPLASSLRFALEALERDSPSAGALLLVTGGRGACQASTCSGACEDEAEALALVRAAREKDVWTIVAGVGNGAVPSAELSALARAGGMPRRCLSIEDCGGGDRCLADGTCWRAYWRLDEVSATWTPVISTEPNYDTVHLATPAERPEWVFVSFNGVPQLPGPDTWLLESNDAVRIVGAARDAARSSTTGRPFHFEVQVLREVR